MSWQTTIGGSDTSPPAAANWSEARETGKQIRRFLVVGTLSVATDLGLYYALIGGITSSTSAAKGISYLVGVAVGFALNKFWTFESRRRSWSEPLSYLSVYLVTLAVNVIGNHYALAVLGGERRLAGFLVATGVTTVLNFLGMRLVAFRRGIHERRSAVNQFQAFDSLTRKAG